LYTDLITFFAVNQLDGINNWGWTTPQDGVIGFVGDIYAGAAKCDINKGTLVGYLTVMSDSGKVKLDYIFLDGCFMREVHIWFGEEELPRNKKGKFTSAPGQFEYVNDSLDDVTEFTYIAPIENWYAFHSVVCCSSSNNAADDQEDSGPSPTKAPTKKGMNKNGKRV